MTAGSIRRRENETPAAHHQAAASHRFNLLPDLIGAQHQRHKYLAFTDRLARDASIAVRGALIVRRREAVDADATRAQLGSLIQRGAAHRAQADDEDVST